MQSLYEGTQWHQQVPIECIICMLLAGPAFMHQELFPSSKVPIQEIPGSGTMLNVNLRLREVTSWIYRSVYLYPFEYEYVLIENK